MRGGACAAGWSCLPSLLFTHLLPRLIHRASTSSSGSTSPCWCAGLAGCWGAVASAQLVCSPRLHPPQDHMLPAEYVQTMRRHLLDRCPVSTWEEVGGRGGVVEQRGASPKKPSAAAACTHADHPLRSPCRFSTRSLRTWARTRRSSMPSLRRSPSPARRSRRCTRRATLTGGGLRSRCVLHGVGGLGVSGLWVCVVSQPESRLVADWSRHIQHTA